ncbi:hypothetical protein N7455_009947 [Penicillium solitum]|uniref:uncharacterized protein n=1 Tax=Penicillium solitum TaxID=60172 RepID=UPI0032C468B7|nr:hypothetical protein N7455_009947 [Penicillium solitum]
MAPVYHGQWAFNGHKLYVTTSSGDVHPRATDTELDVIFTAPIGHKTNVPDYQDHWYEAQLLHYGLAPTKSKAAAKMRLMDAFQDGTLEIPMEILQLEAALRKNWIKQDLESHLLRASSMHQPSLAPTNPEAMEIDTPDHAATQKPEDNMQLRHGHPKRKGFTNAELSTRPMKTVRSRGETGESDLESGFLRPAKWAPTVRAVRER